MYYVFGAAIALVLVVFLSGLRVVKPTTRGLIERLGKYRRFARAGLNWITPGIDRLYKISITEIMVNAEPQEWIGLLRERPAEPKTSVGV